MLGVFDAEEVEAFGEGARDDLRERQSAGPRCLFALEDRAVFVKRAELLRELVQVGREVVGLEFASDERDRVAEAEEVFCEG